MEGRCRDMLCELSWRIEFDIHLGPKQSSKALSEAERMTSPDEEFFSDCEVGAEIRFYLDETDPVTDKTFAKGSLYRKVRMYKAAYLKERLPTKVVLQRVPAIEKRKTFKPNEHSVTIPMPSVDSNVCEGPFGS
jgi:hypothetical protein